MNPESPTNGAEYIEIRYVSSQQELLRAREWRWKSYGWIRYALPAYGVILLGVGFYLYGQNPALAIACLILGPYLILRKRILRYRFLRAVRSAPFFGETVTWKISEEKVVQEIANSRADLAWESFYKALITPDGFLLMPQKNLYYWAPLDGLVDPSQETALRNLILQKTKHKVVQ